MEVFLDFQFVNTYVLPKFQNYFPELEKIFNIQYVAIFNMQYIWRNKK